MRAKKRIYLLDRNEERLSIRRFLFENKGFKVLTDAPEDYCDLVVAGWPCSEEVVKVAQAYRVAFLLLVDMNADVLKFGKNPLHIGADRVLIGAAPWEMVDTVKNLVARKRGPKPVLKAQPNVALKAVS